MKSGSEFQTEKGHSWKHGMVNILLIYILVSTIQCPLHEMGVSYVETLIAHI